MHPCLQVAEITSCVCEMILDYDDLKPASREDINTVASFARTCRAIYAPANHALWGTVTHLAIFVVCTMPKGLWKRSRVKDNEEVQYTIAAHPTRNIKPEDLDRIRFYAPFIHTLYIGLNWSVELSQRGYASFLKAAGPAFFPNLRALAWNADYVDVDYMEGLLTPSIRNMHFYTDSLDENDVAVMREVRQQCPQIQRFRYAATKGTEFAFACAEELFDIAFEYDLVAYSTAFLNEAKIPFLAARKNLRKLCVDVDLFCLGAAMPTGAPLYSLPPNSFGTIQELILHCPLPIATVMDLLTKSSFTDLRALTLRPFPLQPQDFVNIIMAVPTAVEHAELLERLDIFEGSPSSWQDVLEATLNEKVLKPLLRFKSLTHLVMCGAAGIDLTERGIQRMAKAWPNLRTLYIYARTRPYHDVHLRLRHLHHLATGCPKLERLALLVNAEEEPILSSEIPTPDFEHPLKHLGVSVAPIDQADVVAQIIHMLFPKLESLSWRGSSRNEKWNQRWENVVYDLDVEQVAKKKWAEYLDL
ncbi:hypothetical protein EV122DRAFT_269385 [Schizophyllum commune]